MTAGRGVPPEEAADRFRELGAALQPLSREGRPEDIAGAVAYLASEEFITGATLHVDGGVALGG